LHLRPKMARTRSVSRGRAGKPASPNVKAPPAAPKAKAAAAKAPEPIVAAETALFYTMCWVGVLCLVGLVAPRVLMGLYKVDNINEICDGTEASPANATDCALITMNFQSWLAWWSMYAGLLSIVHRNGNTNTMGLMCFANMVVMVSFFATGELKQNQMWIDLGMPEEAANMNRALFAGYTVLNYFGWEGAGSPMPDFAAVFSPASTAATKFTVIVCGAFGGMMTFNPESLFEQYKFTELGGAKDWIAVIFVGFGVSLLCNAFAAAVLVGADKQTGSDINRFYWAFYCAMFYMNAIIAPVTKTLLVPAMDNSMQMFNVVLMAVGAFLARRTMVA